MERSLGRANYAAVSNSSRIATGTNSPNLIFRTGIGDTSLSLVPITHFAREC
jgi:hypothetical protein